MLLGKQGAGKGTQSTRLADHYGVIHVSTGDMFRAQAAQGTAFGLEAKRYMDAGELVPDEIVVGVSRSACVPAARSATASCSTASRARCTRPRSSTGSSTAARSTSSIDLDVPREIVLDRIAGRRVCENCQRVYHVNLPPDARLDLRHVRRRRRASATTTPRKRSTAGSSSTSSETVPIIDYYRERGLLAVVDGVGDGDEVFERLVEASVDEQLAVDGVAASMVLRKTADRRSR